VAAKKGKVSAFVKKVFFLKVKYVRMVSAIPKKSTKYSKMVLNDAYSLLKGKREKMIRGSVVSIKQPEIHICEGN